MREIARQARRNDIQDRFTILADRNGVRLCFSSLTFELKLTLIICVQTAIKGTADEGGEQHKRHLLLLRLRQFSTGVHNLLLC